MSQQPDGDPEEKAQDPRTVAGPDEDQLAIGVLDDSGISSPNAPPVVAGAPSLYLDIDADTSGRGADGDIDARLAQKRSGQL